MREFNPEEKMFRHYPTYVRMNSKTQQHLAESFEKRGKSKDSPLGKTVLPWQTTILIDETIENNDFIFEHEWAANYKKCKSIDHPRRRELTNGEELSLLRRGQVVKCAGTEKRLESEWAERMGGLFNDAGIFEFNE